MFVRIATVIVNYIYLYDLHIRTYLLCFFFSFERVSKDMDIVDFIGGILFMVLFSTDV